MTGPLRLKEMTPVEAARRLDAAPRLIIPAGTLEYRAAHLPLGTDTIILERLADDLSARTGVVRCPAVEFGVHARQDISGPGGASLSRKTLHRVMNELIASWELGAGVEEVVVLTAHAIEGHQEALATIRAAGEVRVVDVFGFEFTGLLTAPTDSLHGGQLDTSLLLHVRPDLVTDAEVIRRLDASADLGHRLYDFILDQIAHRWLP